MFEMTPAVEWLEEQPLTRPAQFVNNYIRPIYQVMRDHPADDNDVWWEKSDGTSDGAYFDYILPEPIAVPTPNKVGNLYFVFPQTSWPLASEEVAA